MTLDDNGTAVGEPPRQHVSQLPSKYLTSCSSHHAAIEEDDEDDGDDDDDDEEKEDSDDEGEYEKEDEHAGPSSVPGQPELSRAWRRELKKRAKTAETSCS